MNWLAWLSLSLAAFAGCSDPVHDQRVAALGPEVDGVVPGPLHRPGQPCGACHGDEGPADPIFSLSGTVYRASDGEQPLFGVTVRAIDSSGAQYATTTNCAGNFYVTPDQFTPSWPIWLKVEYGATSAEMRSVASREGSCAACHDGDPSPHSAGRVFLDTTEVPDRGGCE